jgi:hypothetical protein
MSILKTEPDVKRMERKGRATWPVGWDHDLASV